MSRRLPGGLRAALAATGLSLVVLNSFRAPASELPPTIAQYSNAVEQVLNSKERQSLQPVFELAIQNSPGLQAILPSLSPAELEALKPKSKGLIVNRENPTYVRPSADYFNDLSKSKGTKADRAFFEIYARTEPDKNAIYPAYIRQQPSNTGGCTIFDGPLLIELYRAWLGFRTTYPDDYATEAQGELDSMNAELQAGTCACGSQNEVTAALTAFVKAFPDLPIAPKLRERIDRVKAGTSHIRYHCHGG